MGQSFSSTCHSRAEHNMPWILLLTNFLWKHIDNKGNNQSFYLGFHEVQTLRQSYFTCLQPFLEVANPFYSLICVTSQSPVINFRFHQLPKSNSNKWKLSNGFTASYCHMSDQSHIFVVWFILEKKYLKPRAALLRQRSQFEFGFWWNGNAELWQQKVSLGIASADFINSFRNSINSFIGRRLLLLIRRT